jgi:hypothetical protein
VVVTYTSRPSELTAALFTPSSEGTLAQRLSSLLAHETSVKAPVEGSREKTTNESLPNA